MTGREGFVLGGLTFLGASWVLHCKFGMGSWQCQKTDCRHAGNGKVGAKRKRKRRKKILP